MGENAGENTGGDAGGDAGEIKSTIFSRSESKAPKIKNITNSQN
jgi:hypothetical protein